MITGVLLFSIAVFMISFLIVKRQQRLDQAELAMYIVLIAWGSMIFGIVMLQVGAASVPAAASLR